MKKFLSFALGILFCTLTGFSQSNNELYTTPARTITSFGGKGDGISPNDDALEKAWKSTDILIINKTAKDSIYRIGKHKIPPNKTLVFERGAMLDVHNDLIPDQTQIIAGAYQIFTIDSQIYMGQDPFAQTGRDVNQWIYDFAYVEWFGADPTGVKPSGKAFNKTMKVFVDRVRAPGNYYLIEEQLQPPYMVDLSGGANTHLNISQEMNDDLFYIDRDHKNISNFIIPIPIYTDRPCADGNCRDTTEADAWNHWIFNMDLHYPEGKVFYDYEASRLPTYIENISAYQKGLYPKKLSSSKFRGKCLDNPGVRPKFMRIVPSKNIRTIRQNDTLYDGIQNLAKNVINCFTKEFDTVLFVQGEPERYEGDNSMVQSHAHRFINFFNSGTTGGIVLKENVAQYVFTGLHMSNYSNANKCKASWYKSQTGITLINTKGILMYGTYMDAHSDTIIKILGTSNGNYIQMTNNNLGSKTYLDLDSPFQANNAVGAKDSYWDPTAYGLVPTQFNRGKRWFFGNPANISKVKQYINMFGDLQFEGIDLKSYNQEKIKIDVKNGGDLTAGKYEYRLFLESRDQFDFVFGFSNPIDLGPVEVTAANSKVRFEMPEYPTALVSHFAIFRKDDKGNYKMVGESVNKAGAVIEDDVSTEELTAAKKKQHPRRNENYESLGKAIWMDGEYFIRKVNNSYFIGTGRDNLWTSSNSLVFGDLAGGASREITNSVVIGSGVQSSSPKLKDEMHIGNPNGEWLAGDKDFNVSTPNGSLQTHAIQLGDTTGLAAPVKGEGWAFYDGEHFRDQYDGIFRRRDLVKQANNTLGSTAYVLGDEQAFISVEPRLLGMSGELTLLIRASESLGGKEQLLAELSFDDRSKIRIIISNQNKFNLVFEKENTIPEWIEFNQKIPQGEDVVWGFGLAGGKAKLYMNGVLVSEENSADLNLASLSKANIGGTENNDNGFSGLLGDVLCFNVMLSDDEVSLISQEFYAIPEKYLSDDQSGLLFWLGAEKSVSTWTDNFGKVDGIVSGQTDITHKTKYIRVDKIKTENLEDNGNEIVINSDVKIQGTQQMQGGLQVKAARYSEGTTFSISDVYIYLNPADFSTFFLPDGKTCPGTVFYLYNETGFEQVLSAYADDLINSSKQAVVIPPHTSLTIHNTGLENLGWAIHGVDVVPSSGLVTER